MARTEGREGKGISMFFAQPVRAALVAAAIVLLAGPAAAQGLCPGDPAELGCLKTNANAMLEGDADRFWKAFEAHRAKAAACQDPVDTAAFLDLAYFVKRNEAISARFGPAVENLAVAKPACLLNAALRLRSASLRPLVQQYLKNPKTQTPTAIGAAFAPHRDDPELSRALDLYYEE